VTSRELEWDISVPLVSNVYVIVDILLALLLVSGGVAVVIFYWVGFEHLYSVLRIFVIADGFMIVLLLSVMSFVFLNMFQLIYHLNETGVQVRVGEFESNINRAAWRVSSFAQRHSFTGGKVYTLPNEQHSIKWENITRYVVDERRRVVNLTNCMVTLMRVYCTPDVFDEVVEAVRQYVPEPDEDTF
jgi:hypothetical protein